MMIFRSSVATMTKTDNGMVVLVVAVVAKKKRGQHFQNFNAILITPPLITSLYLNESVIKIFIISELRIKVTNSQTKNLTSS